MEFNGHPIGIILAETQEQALDVGVGWMDVVCSMYVVFMFVSKQVSFAICLFVRLHAGKQAISIDVLIHNVQTNLLKDYVHPSLQCRRREQWTLPMVPSCLTLSPFGKRLRCIPIMILLTLFAKEREEKAETWKAFSRNAHMLSRESLNWVRNFYET